MEGRSGLSGRRVVGITLIVLLVAAVCMVAGLVLGGGIGLVTGGAAGYAIGRARSPHVEIPIPRLRPDHEPRPPEFRLPPDLGDREWDWTPPEGMPDIEIRPYLGVDYEMVEEGARVIAVEPNSPADHAGLRERDLIMAVDGEPVGEGSPPLSDRILEYESGDTVELRVRRGDDEDEGEEIEVQVTLGKRVSIEGHRIFPPGELPELPHGLYPPEGWPHLERGDWPEATVVHVEPDSPADQAGLSAGDLIVAVDGQRLSLENSLADAIAAHKPGDVVTLEVKRPGEESRDVTIELDEHPEKEGTAYLGVRYLPFDRPPVSPFFHWELPH